MEVNHSKAALIVVDVQRDFCPGGALAVNDGDKVVPPLNEVIGAFSKAGLPIYFTRDWHPSNHISFKSLGGPWPQHCVQNTLGAEFNPDLRVPPSAIIISKGDKPLVEAYSGFQGTRLEESLKESGVEELFIGGLTTDYCVRETVKDARSAGFAVSVLDDCVRAVAVKRGDGANALGDMQKMGARLTSSSEVVNLFASPSA
jgi:nicotinamidase/pyrazinamidase